MTFRSESPERSVPATGDSAGDRDAGSRDANDRTEPRATSWSAEIETVYREQGREIWALFYAQCSDPDRAYDALQESFLRLQEQTEHTIRDPRAWLVRVGRNWLRDVARRHRVAAKPTEGLDDLPQSHRPHGHDRTGGEPREELEHRELLSQVRDGLGQLRETDREVLVLRYALGWSSNRIAEVLNSSASSIDMRLSRARKRLAKYLESIDLDNN